jgi:hypothetical protein
LFNASSVLLCLPSSAQEEIAFKAARLQRVAKATAAARLETSAMAAEFQAEREKLLGDIRQLSSLIKQKAGSCAACFAACCALLCCMPLRQGLGLSCSLRLLGSGGCGMAGPDSTPPLLASNQQCTCCRYPSCHAMPCHAMPCHAMPCHACLPACLPACRSW